MRIGKKLTSNAVYLFFNWVSITALSFIYWIIIGKTLPPSSYGIVATSMQIIGLASGLALLGLPAATSRLLPELLAEKKLEKAQGTINYSFKTVALISLIFASIIFFSSPLLSPLLNLPLNALQISALAIIVFSLVAVASSVYFGFQRMRELFKINLTRHIIKVVIAAGLILLGFDYLGPLTAMLIGALTAFLLIYKNCKISKKSIVDKKLILAYALPAFTVAVLSTIYRNTNLILLSAVKTAEITGYFGLATMLVSVIPVIPSVLTQALFPITSALSARKAKEKQAYLIKLVFRYSLFLALPIAFLWAFFSKYLVLLFATKAYLPAMRLIPLLIISAFFSSLAQIFLSSLYAIGEPKIYRNVFGIAVAVYLLTAPLLTLRYAAYGLAIAMIISNACLFAVSYSTLKKFLKIKIAFPDIARVLTASGISFAMILFARPFIHSFYLAGIAVLLDFLLYLIILLRLNFYIKEDVRVLQFAYEKTKINSLARLIAWLDKRVKRSY